MSPLEQGLIILVVTIAILSSGIPVAFGLGAVAVAFIIIFEGASALGVVAETCYASLVDFTLVSMPRFIMMG
ncbi:MAG: TRAP transporter large permease, partial [Hyphomicrobiales bacterium]